MDDIAEIQPGGHELTDLLNLLDIDPEALREAEFMAVQSILDTMIGKRIANAVMEETRIVIETEGGDRYFFYGFIGSGH